jgi:DtxR family Mn-dependent transcriptional regulator
VLAPIFANNISITPLATPQTEEDDPQFLSDLKPGQKGRVLGISRLCHGQERQRLFDLGFVPGTEVTVEMVSPTGEPTAYTVRGTVTALRRAQSNLIRIALLDSAPVSKP